ncbi:MULTISPECIES: Bug family tripartite tricarboxylate transporter substrate binding protein [Variovorax]|jgi:tripartite-type tricarboxylate transporter receptor subunit TctC|uniref:Bug family tripartite tricarboxylate transporter substrate binding protein n=1 Tax=Variovorax TaxID=34072 RepID=UPI000C3FF2C9|nr:tripartite tricarboxylate transporter substrate binding protein [Variovorax sp.]MBS78934.1 LacI family transcriptional regulator [Variovorax sp.]
MTCRDPGPSYRPSRRALLRTALLAGAAGALPDFASAQGDYPNHAITMVVPFPPGGPTDVVARLLCERLGRALKQAVIIENRPGANANIGTGAVAKAPADGYTVLYNTSSIVMSPALYRSLPYDLNRDFAPVALTATVPLALVVNNDLPVRNVKEFVAYAKAHPGKLSYGSAGSGSPTHLAALQFAQAAGIEATHVPYKGTAPADIDLAAGQLQFMTDTINTIASFVKGKRVRMLALMTPQRVSLYPDVPTLAESGFPGFEAQAWQGMLVPAGTPAAVVEKLNAEINRVLKSKDVLDALALQGAGPLGGTPQEYAAYLKKELGRWTTVIKGAGVTMD